MGERLNFLECAEGDYGVLKPMGTDAKVEKYEALRVKSQQSARRLSFLREVIGVVPAISVDVDQCETVIAEDTSVAVDAVGEIPKRYAVHLALFAIEAVDVSGCEKERRTGLNDARDIRNCPNRVLGIEMEHNAPRHRSIEHAIGERAGLNNSSNSKRFGTIVSKVCQHRTRTIQADDSVAAAQQRTGDGYTVATTDIENKRSAWDG